MTKSKEFTVKITKSGQIFYKNSLIAILGQWNHFEDLDPDNILDELKEI